MYHPRVLLTPSQAQPSDQVDLASYSISRCPGPADAPSVWPSTPGLPSIICTRYHSWISHLQSISYCTLPALEPARYDDCSNMQGDEAEVHFCHRQRIVQNLWIVSLWYVFTAFHKTIKKKRRRIGRTATLTDCSAGGGEQEAEHTVRRTLPPHETASTASQAWG